METATLVASPKRHWTDKELMSLPKDGRKYELIEGDLLMSPVGMTHSDVCINISTLLTVFVRPRKLGKVFDSSMGYRLSRTVLLSPDVSFVSNARLAEILVAPDKFLYGAPDLVVEVLSPTDSLKLIEDKLDRYFEHGTRLAWVVDCRGRTVSVRTTDGITKLAKPGDVLTGGEVLPGFRCRLRRIFVSQ
jgi:Uma2 family endonuclease